MAVERGGSRDISVADGRTRDDRPGDDRDRTRVHPGAPGARAFERRRADVIATLAGVGVLAACGAVARSGTVGPLEADVFHAINRLPEAWYPPLQAAQYLGVMAVGPIVVVGALAARRWRLAGAAAAVTLGKLAAERVVWQLVQRSRPGTSIQDAIVRGNAPDHGASFVSGHLVLVTALATVVTPYLHGWWRVVPWGVVVVVGFARVYLGAHAPLDVVGGAGLGLAIGGLANVVFGVPSRRAVRA